MQRRRADRRLTTTGKALLCARETHATFESYVRDCEASRRHRFDYTRAAAYYLIKSSTVYENLKCQQFVDTNKSTNVLPTKESQCRPLAKLSPERQREVWQTAVDKAEGKVPSARIVKGIISQSSSDVDIKAKPKDSEMIYKSGVGIDYIVHLDEETYKLLQSYQGRIGKATKNGAIRSLLDNAIAE